MDNVPDSIYFKDRQSRFTRINSYAAARFGVGSPALAVGRTDFDFFAEEQLERRAFYDPLTDLPNRALFLDRLQHMFHRARRALGNSLFAVLYLDLDRFKSINDSLGHQAGDEMLVGIARRLERCLRPGDTLARLGGDEFTVLLDDINCEADAIGVAERIHEELAAPIDVRGYEMFPSVSVGIALSSAGYECPEDMLRDADTAMYRAKAGGRARHQVFAGDMHQRAVSSLQLETDQIGRAHV